jgi:hypothetical protein
MPKNSASPGRAWAKAAAPTIPSPPVRFSTTSGWPRRRDNLSARRRAAVSGEVPGGTGTIMRDGPDAAEGRGAPAAKTRPRAARRRVVVGPVAMLVAIAGAGGRLSKAFSFRSGVACAHDRARAGQRGRS